MIQEIDSKRGSTTESELEVSESATDSSSSESIEKIGILESIPFGRIFKVSLMYDLGMISDNVRITSHLVLCLLVC